MALEALKHEMSFLQVKQEVIDSRGQLQSQPQMRQHDTSIACSFLLSGS